MEHAMEPPSKWWCTWQCIKGTNSTQLSVPAVDLRGKQAVVTGGNNGIGFEAALAFASMGAHVLLVCRNPPPHETHPDVAVEKCRAAARAAGHADSNIEWWICDMADLATVDAFTQRWLETGRAIDILASNAGIGGTVGRTVITKDGYELTHQVNFLSHTLVIVGLLPALAKAAAPRVICTTSCMQFLGNFNLINANEAPESYANNKLYYQTWLTELQRRLLQRPEYRHITVQGVHPGFVRTGIWAGLRQASVQEKMSTIGKLVEYSLVRQGIDAQQGSLTIVNAATSIEAGPNPETQGVGVSGGRGGGRYWSRTWEETPMPQSKDDNCREQVWGFVKKELGKERSGLWIL